MKIATILLFAIFSQNYLSQDCSEVSLTDKMTLTNDESHLVYHITKDENGDFQLVAPSEIKISSKVKLVLAIDDTDFSEYYHFEVHTNESQKSLEIDSAQDICGESTHLILMIGDKKIQTSNLIIE